jgi:hypothetical protein
LGQNKGGEPCSAYVEPGASWCKWHDPSRAAERAEWARKGGAARSNRARAKKKLEASTLTIADIDSLLCRALVQVAGGKLEPVIGTSLASIAKTITGIRSAGELETRLEALERSAGIRRIG